MLDSIILQASEIAAKCLITESQNYRMLRVGRDLCGSSSPTPLPKQGHLQQAAVLSVKKNYQKNTCYPARITKDLKLHIQVFALS